MEIGEIIKQKREELGFSQRQLSYMSGVSNTEIKRIEDGERRQPSQDILKKLAGPLRVDYKDLLEIAGYYVGRIAETIPVKNVAKIPIYGEIRAGNPMLAQEEVIGYEYLASDEVRGGEYFFLRVKGDSMIGARIQDGDLVLVRKQPTLENGQIGVFIIEDEATIKIFHRQGNTAILMPANTSYEPISVHMKDLTIVGEVVEIKVKLNGR